MAARKRALTVSEILNLLDTYDESIPGISGIYIEPPDPSALSDEDSAEEDYGGLLDNLSGNQLRAPGEIIYAANEDETSAEEDDILPQHSDKENSDDDEPPPRSSKVVAVKVPSSKSVKIGTRKSSRKKAVQQKAKNCNTKKRNAVPMKRNAVPINRNAVANKRNALPLQKRTSKSTKLFGPSPWAKYELEQNVNATFPVADFNKYKSMSAVEVFELFFTDDLIEIILRESRKYAVYRNEPDQLIKKEEVRVFIAILMVSGYNTLPGKKMYWDMSDDMKNLAVTKAMRRDRFIQIMKYIHFSDNKFVDPNDKFWKLRPLFDHLRCKCLENFVPVQEISYDESMVKYYDRHGCKQFIRGKPIRFGYKVWCMNTFDGYLINFEAYQGRSIRGTTEIEALVGKCASPLLTMISEFNPYHKALPFKFYLDNLFTGMNLLIKLQEMGYGCTGTLRKNRIPKDYPDDFDESKSNRGDFNYHVNVPANVVIVKWKDNAVVNAASTCHSVHPIKMVTRYSQEKKAKVQVPPPNIIACYNNFMGGTDQMDQNIGRYRIGIRGKKWWWSIFTWSLDAMLQNAWILQRRASGKLSQLEFRRAIVSHYLSVFAEEEKGGSGRTKKSKKSVSKSAVSDKIRYDRSDLFVGKVTGMKRRCAGDNCKSYGRTECKKCNVGLCVDCFQCFHTL